MFVASLLKREYYELILKIRQEKEAKLPYYGPLVRGWLGDAFYQDRMLSSVLFENPSIDVRPFFFYTTKKGNIIIVNLQFMGFSEHFIKEIMFLLSNKAKSHIGGVNCKVEGISYKEKFFQPKDINKRFKVNFITPSALFERGEIQKVPFFESFMKALIRSANKFTKYYVKDVYPIRVERFKEGEVKQFKIDSFSWRHRNVRGEEMLLKGVWGWVEYEIEEMTEEMKEMLSLADFFQIGKWVSYGFGKVEVIENS